MIDAECFAVWAPTGVVWSQWAKPVTFTQISRTASPPGEEIKWDAPEIRGVPSPGRTAVVVDAPGPSAVRLGVVLARIGYRPVPLFNATSGYQEVIDIDPIAQRLRMGTEQLRQLHLPANAPPAFLLDSQRMHPPVLPTPGKFDNRWVALPQDFPSGTMLRANGILEVLLLHFGGQNMERDLLHVLRRWQDAGLRMTIGDLNAGGDPKPFDVPRPSLFRMAWYRVIAVMGLRRSDVGGFGGPVPQEGTGSGIGFG